MTEIKQGVPSAAETKPAGDTQLLHLVFGGELDDPKHVRFRDLDALDIVGVYPNYATAFSAWKAKAQATVDNAHMRYFIVHLHRLLEPPVG
ncbi:DUF4170 domain-containing protein [Salinarimonas ramus]|uniref:Inositol monophosphatase n=1 Tax=Salinarimonas ramus TaxID=690164 RepID=A0A917V3G1_9HYPH|nr:DUF4170 domain-containing protein [Salinarimonas ramus]GGK30735.1 inositol monophosphatase [Salinarimonas ramus]